MSKTKLFAAIMGALLVGFGALGFFSERLFGIPMAGTENALHVMVGLTGLYVGTLCTIESARMFCRSFGTLFFCLGVLGCLAPDALARLFGYQVLAGDTLALNSACYVLMGYLMLAIGLFPRPYAWTATYYTFTVWRSSDPLAAP